MATPQTGIFALGDSAHVFLEFTRIGGSEAELVRTVVDIREPHTTVGGVEFSEKEMPADSHVQRTTVNEGGTERKIFRRNVPYGNVSDHGTVFIGFSADRDRLQKMLEQMAGVGDGIRDALTYFTTPLTGALHLRVLAAVSANASRSRDGRGFRNAIAFTARSTITCARSGRTGSTTARTAFVRRVSGASSTIDRPGRRGFLTY